MAREEHNIGATDLKQSERGREPLTDGRLSLVLGDLGIAGSKAALSSGGASRSNKDTLLESAKDIPLLLWRAKFIGWQSHKVAVVSGKSFSYLD